MPRVTVKTSTIFISVGDKTRVFRSVEEVPPRLRKKLEQSTNGMNSATILIADRRGREEIVKAIRGLPSSVRSRLAGTLVNPERPKPETPSLGERAWWRNWPEMLAPLVVGALVWLLFRLT
jgi:hypothetical protein